MRVLLVELDLEQLDQRVLAVDTVVVEVRLEHWRVLQSPLHGSDAF